MNHKNNIEIKDNVWWWNGAGIPKNGIISYLYKNGPYCNIEFNKYPHYNDLRIDLDEVYLYSNILKEEVEKQIKNLKQWSDKVI